MRHVIMTSIVLVLALLVLGARAMLIKIEPGSVGTVNREWTSGFADEDFGPGYHWNIGPFHTWTVFDTTVQTLHMIADRTPNQEGTRPLEVKSKDGATVTMELSIKYQIAKGAAWQVMKDLGPSQAIDVGYKRLALTRSIRVLQESLGSMDTEDFYSPSGRASVQRRMEEALGMQFEELHLDLIGLLIRDIQFDATFEDGIKDKALAQERQNLNIAETLAADFLGRTAKVRRQTEANVVIIDEERDKQLATMTAENDRRVAAIRADFEKRVIEIRSDADLYAAKKAAEGILLIKKAEAEGQALRRQAVASAGGEVLVALEMATNLNLDTMVISTQQMNPLDINEILRSLGIK